jgi:hypothetical protein
MREGDDNLYGGFAAFAGLDHVIPLTAGRIGQHFGFTGEEVRKETHVIGMIGDDEEIERARELHWLATRCRDFFAAGEAIGVARAEPRAERPSVHRKRGMQMRIAEERARWEVTTRVGRIRGLLMHPFGPVLI